MPDVDKPLYTINWGDLDGDGDPAHVHFGFPERTELQWLEIR